MFTIMCIFLCICNVCVLVSVKGVIKYSSVDVLSNVRR